MNTSKISIVTPTYYRTAEVLGLLENISKQSFLPDEIILVDGADPDDASTEDAVAGVKNDFPFRINYIRSDRGTAIQRNRGIEAAQSEFVAFIDDDVRLQPDFFEKIVAVMEGDVDKKVGGIVGYRTNEYFNAGESERWRWYKKLRLLTIYEPGRYDFASGYPINSNMQPPFEGVRRVDFMTTACAVWRREVFASGLRFDSFFRDYGVLEDAHFSLRAGRNWKLLQCGHAQCDELHSPHGRVSRRKIGYKCVANYYYVFRDISGPLNRKHKFRFWRFQAFELFRLSASAVRRLRFDDVKEIVGRVVGILSVLVGVFDR